MFDASFDKKGGLQSQNTLKAQADRFSHHNVKHQVHS